MLGQQQEPPSTPALPSRERLPLEHSISTGNPEFRVSREQAFRHAADATDPASPVARVLERVYNNSRIDSRYFCIPDLLEVTAAGRLGGSGLGLGSATGAEEREEANVTATAAAQGVIAGSAGNGRGAGERRVAGSGEGLPMFYPADGR